MTNTGVRVVETPVFARRLAPPDFKQQASNWDVWKCGDLTFVDNYEQEVTLFVDQGATTITFSSCWFSPRPDP